MLYASSSRLRLTIAGACLAALSAAATAGTICHSSGFAGYEAQVAHAVRVLPAVTSDPLQVAIYTEQVGRVFYYQSNYVRPGSRYPTKILSETRLPLKAVLENVLYTSAAEATAAARTTAAIIASNLVLRGDTKLIDGGPTLPPVELAMAQPVGSAR
jgi:hypothetical protein